MLVSIAPYLKAFTDMFGEGYYIDTIHSLSEYKYLLMYTGSTTDYKQDGTGWTLDTSSNTTDSDRLNSDPLGYTPKVEREGYTFIGWYDEYGKYYNSQTIFDAARDVTLTGKWTKTIVPTGDDSDPAFFALMMLGSLVCAGAIIIRLRKREDEV